MHSTTVHGPRRLSPILYTFMLPISVTKGILPLSSGDMPLSVNRDISTLSPIAEMTVSASTSVYSPVGTGLRLPL